MLEAIEGLVINAVKWLRLAVEVTGAFVIAVRGRHRRLSFCAHACCLHGGVLGASGPEGRL
jgi:hypothetical protein